jgi:HAD superfamily hydrolase (TIGR01549 family)
MALKAVLFDVGGPLDTEASAEALVDRHIKAALAVEGIDITDGVYAAANQWAIDSFAWNTYQAIFWRLSGGNSELASRFSTFSVPGRPFELRDGIPALLEKLHGRGLRLGLAANQPTKTIAKLDELGIGHFFSHREVSAIHGYHKPDVRLFIRACEDLRVDPAETIMVGDRVDNDIVPANILGMYTVLFRTGRHIGQQPRSLAEVPDAEVHDVSELEAAILAAVEGL